MVQVLVRPLHSCLHSEETERSSDLGEGLRFLHLSKLSVGRCRILPHDFTQYNSVGKRFT